MSQATQGQHLRLQFGAAGGTKDFVTFSTDLTLHVSSTLENSTTKDDTDVDGAWITQEKTKVNIDGSVTAILDDNEAQNFSGMAAASAPLEWELDWVSGNQNRQNAIEICSGTQMILSNVEISAPRDGFCQLTGNFVIYGDITVA